jgi:hypothetical protein
MTEIDSPIIIEAGDRDAPMCQYSGKLTDASWSINRGVAAGKSNLAMNQRARHAA